MAKIDVLAWLSSVILLMISTPSTPPRVVVLPSEANAIISADETVQPGAAAREVHEDIGIKNEANPHPSIAESK